MVPPKKITSDLGSSIKLAGAEDDKFDLDLRWTTKRPPKPSFRF